MLEEKLHKELDWLTIKHIDADGVIRNILSICQQEIGEAKPKWISVKDRLPEETGRYWCYVKEYNDLGISHFQWNCAWNVDEQRWNTNEAESVTHWMLLPESPKESE